MIKKIFTFMLALAFCLTVPVNAANIIWVSDGYDDNADGASDDLEWVSILEAEGYSVDYQINALGDGYWRTLDDDKIAALNAADCIIVSRNSDSGSYDDDDEIAQWNAVTAPLINCSTHIVRSSRWKWLDSTTILSLTPDMVLADGTAIPGINAEVGMSSFMDSGPGNGTVLATGDGLPWIIEWEAGVEYYDGAGEIAGGPRMFFVAGTQEDAATGVGRGEMNLKPEALAVFLDAVAKYAPLPIITDSPQLNNWAAVASAASPGFIAANVADGVYDIGTYGGEQTYEFVVNANPDETEASMCLLGRRNFGDPRVGLKFDQWENTGEFGATIFGVVDLYYGVPAKYGVDTHVVFVSSAANSTTDLYVDGAYQATVDRAIGLSGLVGIGYLAESEDGSAVADPFDGDVLGVAIYDAALSADEIAAHAAAYFNVITSVVRANGVSGDRDPIGAYDGSTTPLPTEPGGLKDGNLVFSDRTYPWSGIPAEYTGTEYIRTFNSDKNGGTVDVTYTVTTSQYAMVWITVDDRIPAEWDSGGTITSQQDAADRVTAAIGVQFLDTGIDIYVHENDTTDRQMSVFAAELPAGTYVFDSMDSGKNFYNIGAIPWPEPAPEPEGPALSDVTSPGDAVLGVPNDGDWPGGEHPALAIDNSSGTKYLHFKGPQGITGIQVTPSAGATIVTGLTFTTANDAPERDPIAFELSGSNVGIDGPYEVIATGDIVDFAQADASPRFTKNTTPISFDNDVAYTNYQVIITAVRDAAAANSMQVSEIELLGFSVQAFSPQPGDGAVSVAIDTDLSWSAGAGAVASDVYFGTTQPLPLIDSVPLPDTSLNPGILEYGTTYYWQVNTVKADGSVEPGVLWSFTTTTPVGIFEYTQDIGAPAGIGRTTYEGYVWKDDKLTEQYLMMGCGADVWDHADQFHFAYNEVSGDVRVSASFEWIVASNDWAKYGVMLRETTGGPSAHYFMCDRKARDYAALQGRTATGNSSSEFGTAWNATNAKALGIQRVTFAGKTWIEGLVDVGDGWESTAFVPADLADELMAGVAITSHDNTHLAQARAWNVKYELNPGIVKKFPLVPASADLGAPTSDVSGFMIESLKPLVTDGWGYAAVREIFDTGTYMGLPPQPGSQGTRISEFVNLRDTGNGAFSVDNGYPDETFPGIDPDEVPAQDPAAGDDDDNHGSQITASIHLTAGIHIIGASSDDGTIIEIGGVEIGRTIEWKGTSNEDFIFEVEADGYYNLRALYIEGGGGSSLELHEVLPDGTRLLLNDVANGGSAVYAPAP